jgi:hypothetical protein
MGCAIGCLALVFPRLTLLLVWLFGPPRYLIEPFPATFWPILGFLFLPTTTLAFAFSSHSFAEGTGLSPFGWLFVIVALAIDLGLLGGGGRAARPRVRREREDTTRTE